MPKRLWLWLSMGVLLAGCQRDQVVLLDSTPTKGTSTSVTKGGTSYQSESVKRSQQVPAMAGETIYRGELAERSRRDWAQAAPIVGRLESMGEVTRITVHHSGEVNDLDSEEDISAYLRRVQTSQSRTKASGGLGAGDVAYHFIIDRNGVTWEGRAMRYQGAHAGNPAANRGNVGICVLGNFNVQYPNERQKESLKVLLSRLMERYGLSEKDIYTHREIRAYYGLSTTDCPGKNLQPVVDAMRHRFKAGR